jgi:ABC-type arginine transport system permease subunit
MNNKNYGNKVAEILLILFSFAVGSILLPLILGFIQLFGDLAYYLNTNIRDNYPLVFWGLSIIIGVIVTYWSHKKQAK